MKIHLTGTIWQAGVTENLRRAFEASGHEVFFFDKNISQSHRILKNLAGRFVRRPHGIENYFFKIVSERWLQGIEAFKPDLIFIEDAPSILPQYVARAREFKIPIFYFVQSPPYWPGCRDELVGLQYVDEVFCIDREWFKYIAYFFEKPVRYFPFGANKKDYYPMEGAEKLYDAIFVASAPAQGPDGGIRAKFITSIHTKYNVAVFGDGWNYWLQYFPSLASRIKSSSIIDNKKANLAYNQAKIVLTLHSSNMPTSLGVRTFDIAAAGAFQLVDFRPNSDLDTLFPKGLIPTYASFDDLNEKIGYWLRHEKEREKIVSQVQTHVFAQHTWEKRVAEVLTIYKDRYSANSGDIKTY